MIHSHANALIAATILLFFALLIPATRAILGYLFSRILHPASQAIILHLMKRVWAMILAIWRAHVVLLRNLLKPKDKVYPDLAQDLEKERRDLLKPGL